MSSAAMVETAADAVYGGSAAAIRYHYDVGFDFYRLFLDETMTYSCAWWDETRQDTLQEAQLRKIDHHLRTAGVPGARSLLDIGCGWGSLVARAAEQPALDRIVGLTLSMDQAQATRRRALHRVEVQLQSWVDHEPDAPYDAIVSVGAFEHFATPEQSPAEKVAVYRDFFSRCRDWLSPCGRMSLQTIAYGSMGREEASAFINNEIFPSADLPTLAEIAEAASGVMEIGHVFNHRLHYAATLEAWASALRGRREQAVALVGHETYERYLRYLRQTAAGFFMGKIHLLRIGLASVPARRARRLHA